MTIAEVRGKISETGSNLSERMEDLLTSDVFGCFRYIPPELGLKPFLETAQSPNAQSIYYPAEVVRVRYSFWPWLKIRGCNSCEPDLVIGVETKQGIHVYMIEAKYYSGLSSDSDDSDSPNDQLARELDNLDHVSFHDFAWPPNLNILSRNLIFITKDMKIPSTLIANSLEEYTNKQCNDGDIFWTSWRFLPNLIQKKMDEVSEVPYQAVLQDMLSLLKKKGLEMFHGIQPVDSFFRKIDFRFYKISSRQYRWPSSITIIPVSYRFRKTTNRYLWTATPNISITYRYTGG